MHLFIWIQEKVSVGFLAIKFYGTQYQFRLKKKKIFPKPDRNDYLVPQ